jgi:TolB-like protein/DNA-binding winged helix-turn-helix (wHTH) protein/Flp pilus assembly protein TadD
VSDSGQTFRFRDFELDVAAYALRRHGRPVRLERQGMDLLILLVERRRQLVTRSDIVDRLWGKDVFVDVETGVNTVISKVRQALHDSPNAAAFVETVPGKGYRFIAPVEVVLSPDTLVQPETPSAIPPSSPSPGIAAAADAASVVATRVATETEPGPASAVRGSRRGWLVAGVLSVAALAGVLTWAWQAATRPGSRVTLAVLPFENLSGDPEREYLADGLAEETTVSLGQIDPERVSVVGRTSTLRYKRTTKSLAEIGQELGADYLVESSIRAESGRWRITAKLIRVRDQVQVWSESYNREPASMLGLQQELSTAIAEHIHLRLSPERLNALARRHPRNADAYDFYLRGRYFWNQLTPATNKRAVEYYERAIALDPSYALAWSGIADAFYASPINSDEPPLNLLVRARDAATRAVQAGPDLAEAQTSRGNVNLMLDWDWTAAEAAFRRAIAIDPSYALAHRNLGHVLSQMGRHREARAAVQRAREVDPLYAMNHAISSQVAFQARDYPAALEHARQTIIVDPDFWIGYMQLGQVYEQLGEADLALESLANAARLSRGNSKPISFRGHVLAKLRRMDEARDVLRTLDAVSRERYVPPYMMALVHAGLGEREAVFQWLNRAYDARDVHLIFLPVDPKWDPYRADPRFEALLARCAFTRTATTDR